jgi:transposase
LAKSSKSAEQTRRLLALAEIYDGGSRGDAARVGGVGRQTVRDWVLAFNAKGPDGLLNGKAPGNPPLLNAAQRQALAEIVTVGPTPGVDGVVRWRLVDLIQWVFDQFRISISKQTLSRTLRAMDFRKLSARPRHNAQDVEALEAFKKNFPACLKEIAAKEAAGNAIELWWQDEARVGQKTQITRRWARRGTRPIALRDQRTKSAWLFGAICPALGKAAGLVLPSCNTEGMVLHLAEISRAVAPGAHAVVLLDQAGWHLATELTVPDNITLLPLPPKCPELNPVENIWQFIRQNWLSNRIFSGYKDILDHCEYAWKKLASQPWTIMSIGMRDWAYGL